MRLCPEIIQVMIAGATMLAQETAKPNTATVHGVVLNQRADNAPIRKATVQLQPLGDDQRESLQIQTDAAGQFHFDDVAPGRYEINASKQGFFQSEGPARRLPLRISVQKSENVEGVTIRLAPAAAIRGQITDEDGDPVADAEVGAVTRNNRTGNLQGYQTKSATTDEHGEYRIHDLPPGRYVLVASTRYLGFSETTGSGKRSAQLAVPTYFPSTSDARAASEIAVAAGDERVANISILHALAVTVKGTVTLSSGKIAGQGAVFAQAAGGAGDDRAVSQIKNGDFEISVTPGRYLIVAMISPDDLSTENIPQMTRQTIEVGTDGLRDVKLVIGLAGTKIRGRARVEGDAKIDFAKLYVALSLKSDDNDELPSGFSVISRPGGHRSLAALEAAQGLGMAKLKPDGSFEIPELPSGNYDIEVGSQEKGLESWYLKSIFVGTRDVGDSGLKIAGLGTMQLTLVLSPAGAQIEGVVIDPDQCPVEQATVITVPDAAHPWRSSLYHRASTDQKGHFAIQGVEPGSYRVFAWDEIDEGAWLDNEYLKTVRDQGAPVEVREGDKKQLHIKAIVAGEHAPCH